MNMKPIGLVLAAVATMAACGGDDGGGGDDDVLPSGDTFESGTRLHAVFQDGGGGAVRLVRWLDTQLDAPCRFAYATDGVLRCLPAMEFGVQYVDAACTQPVALFASTDPVAPMIVATELGCPGPLRRGTAYNVGAVHALTSAYHREGDGSCQPSGTVTPDVTPHDLTVADPAMFVAGELATVARDGDGDTQAIRGADGAYQALNALDATGAACATGNIDGRCMPLAMSYSFGELFGDASCTQPAAYSVGAVDCPTPSFAIVYARDTDGCYTRTAASVGAAIPDANIYEAANGGTCAPLTYDRGSRYFALGAAAADPFLHISAVDVGTGRLRARHLANAQGVLLAPSESPLWRDEQLDTDCGVFDGRCAPSQSISVMGGGAFADAACTQHLFETSTLCVGAPTIPGWIGATDQNGTVVGAYQVGAPFTGTVYMLTNGTTCEPRTVEPSTTFYALGAMSGVDILAAVPEVTDG